MAFSFQSGGTRRGRGSMHSLAEINIVPLVDVVLVLLVIFMLTAHVMEFGLEVDVPKVKQVKDSARELPVITLTKTGEMFLNEKPVNINRLGDEIRQRFPGQKAVYVRADKNTVWDPIAQVIAQVGAAGLQANMVTSPTDAADR